MKKIKNNYWKWGICIILVVLICATVIYMKMPKRVCHTEIKTEKFVVNMDIRSFSINSEIICEGNVKINTYEYQKKKVIYGYSWEQGNTCLVRVKERYVR